MNAKDKISQIEDVLEREQSGMWPKTFQINILKRELLFAYKEKKMFWQQKGRNRWLILGDGNTSFFHGSVKVSRAKNSVEMLRDEHGHEQRAKASKGEVASSYFTKLFTSSNPDEFHYLFHDFRPKVTDEMNKLLISSVTKEEIREIVFFIKATKALGPDGMTGSFSQAYWEIIGDRVSTEIHKFFETC